MIGGALRGSGWSMMLAVVLLSAFCARSSQPASADPTAAWQRDQRLRALASSSDARLADLQGLLVEVRNLARRGAGLVIAGDEPPGRPLEVAAEQLRSASADLLQARTELTRLVGSVSAVRGDAVADSLPTLRASPDTLEVTARQLEDAARGATAFVARRHQAEAVLELLLGAVEALDAGHEQQAVPLLDDVDAAIAELGAWQTAPTTFAQWLATVTAWADAARAIAEAVISGDPERIESAAMAYAEAAATARGADHALALAMSDGGSSVTIGALQAIASLLAEVDAARAGVASLYSGA